MLAAVLGILKAGGEYLPLDPAIPDDRLGFMVRDSSLEIIVSNSPLADRLARCQVCVVDPADDEMEATPRPLAPGASCRAPKTWHT